MKNQVQLQVMAKNSFVFFSIIYKIQLIYTFKQLQDHIHQKRAKLIPAQNIVLEQKLLQRLQVVHQV